VTDTIRKGIIDIEPYENNTALLMVGNVAALSGNVLFVCSNISFWYCLQDVTLAFSFTGDQSDIGHPLFL